MYLHQCFAGDMLAASQKQEGTWGVSTPLTRRGGWCWGSDHTGNLLVEAHIALF